MEFKIDCDKFWYHTDLRVWYKMTKLSNGQIAYIDFRNVHTRFRKEYYVGFMIANKKKHIKAWLEGEHDFESYTTGKSGLEGLLWAKNQIKIFIDTILSEGGFIYVGHADAKRRKVYRRGLRDIGFKEMRFDSGYYQIYKK